MGLVWLMLLGLAAMGAAVRLGVPRALWTAVGAALMLGATGYALQGRPMLPGRPARGAVAGQEDDPALTDLRDRLLGRYTLDHAYMVAGDAMTRRGDRRAAARAILGGVRKLPESFALWTELGTVLAAHDGQVSPAAKFAFDRAGRLAPQQPGPPFFEGLAYVRAGDFAAARPYWARALALSPRDASYTREIAVRLALLDRYLATGAAPGGS